MRFDSTPYKCTTYKAPYDLLTDERESPQKAQPARENSSLGFIETVQLNYDDRSDRGRV